ncbi:MAG: hypothetical protein Q9168_003786 [Polycauliona sp. 1 TL-2023]
MYALLLSILSLVVTILLRTAVVAMCGHLGWRLWTSMKSMPTLVVSEPAEAAAAPVPSSSWVPMPSFDVREPSFDVREDSPQRPRKKKKKSVQFDMVKNTLHRYTPVKAKFVTFHWKKKWLVYCHEYDPAGYDTLHCAKTKYIRDVPDLDLVDADGDIGMNEY